MRVIKVNENAFEKEFTCYNCKSVLAYTYNDIHWGRDMGGCTCPYLTCPVCGHCHDMEGQKLPPKREYGYNRSRNSEDK